VTVPEAELRRGKHGLEPAGQGWFVLNAADAPRIERPGRGFYAEFEGFHGAADFSQLGINITVLAPGEPVGMYHYENDQEDFLVLAGKPIRHGVGVERATPDADVTYARFGASRPTGFRPGLLPE